MNIMDEFMNAFLPYVIDCMNISTNVGQMYHITFKVSMSELNIEDQFI